MYACTTFPLNHFTFIYLDYIESGFCLFFKILRMKINYILFIVLRIISQFKSLSLLKETTTNFFKRIFFEEERVIIGGLMKKKQILNSRLMKSEMCSRGDLSVSRFSERRWLSGLSR